MTMTRNARWIVRRLARFLNKRDAIVASWHDAADRDAAFDAGEWSGPACDKAAEKEIDSAAKQLGFADAATAEHLANAIGVHI